MKHCIKKEKLYCFSMGVLLLAGATILTILYWLIFPYKIAEVKSPAEVIKKELCPGDHLVYHFEGEIYGDYPVMEIRRKLSNEILFTLTPNKPPKPLSGKINQLVISNKIPEEVLPGTYKMVFEAVHKVNPIREVYVTWETEEFVILEADDCL